MKLSEFKEPEPVTAPPPTVEGKWSEVDEDIFLSWSESKQWRYCFLRDMNAARHAKSPVEAEWYRNRGAQFLVEAKRALEEEKAREAKSGDWIVHIG